MSTRGCTDPRKGNSTRPTDPTSKNDRQSIIRQNRTEATRGWDYTKGSPDEFPYASNRQGGAGPTVDGVSRSAQRSQGGSLSGCYRSNKIGDSDYFSSFIN
ncbi:NucA/NucB deoxyribonuclease domain-containing protein [uncultured Corynebacterium sp.]|uniref:NucA/NucB deoxyribonuclease domain-containing protein n=1 Tax=uncultured Corynebacterium sp. TaxID=159447 RepID=UPI00345C0174